MEPNNFNFTIFTTQFIGLRHPASPSVEIIDPTFFDDDGYENQIIFPMVLTFVYFEDGKFTLTPKSHDALENQEDFT